MADPKINRGIQFEEAQRILLQANLNLDRVKGMPYKRREWE